jgi:hypothetical protein
MRHQKLRGAREFERPVRKELIPVWGKRPVTEITRQDLLEARSAVAGVSRPQLPRVCSTGQSSVAPTASRGRPPTGRAPFGPFVQFLLISGQRRSEVSGMRWGEIKDDPWTVPPERFKSDATHLVPLSPAAVDLRSSWRSPLTGPRTLFFLQRRRRRHQRLRIGFKNSHNHSTSRLLRFRTSRTRSANGRRWWRNCRRMLIPRLNCRR